MCLNVPYIWASSTRHNIFIDDDYDENDDGNGTDDDVIAPSHFLFSAVPAHIHTHTHTNANVLTQAEQMWQENCHAMPCHAFCDNIVLTVLWL